MAVPAPADEVAINARLAIDKARKALDDPEFVKRLNPGEKTTYEAQLKDAEDALTAYKTANPGGVGMLGSTAAMRTTAGGNPVGVITVGVILVAGYLLKGAIDNAQHKALLLALSLLAAHNQVITTRVIVSSADDWAKAISDTSPSTLRLLLMSIILDRAKISPIIESIKKDIKDNPNNCCPNQIEAFKIAAGNLLRAVQNSALVPGATRKDFADVFLKAVAGLYQCLQIVPPFIVRQVLPKPETCPK